MYGACESVEDEENTQIVHNLLRRFKIWNGEPREAQKYLENQIVVGLVDDAEEDLS